MQQNNSSSEKIGNFSFKNLFKFLFQKMWIVSKTRKFPLQNLWN